MIQATIRALRHAAQAASRGVFTTATALCVAGAPACAAHAAGYPNQPIHIIVPFGPGGLADVTTRLVAQKLSDKFGDKTVVENLPGAGGHWPPWPRSKLPTTATR